MIIWIPERLNLTSGNKLLKMLEEPPHMTLFVLVAESLEPILPTILSRCQLVRIPPLDDHSMQTYLTQHTDKHETLITNSILLSSGNMVKALSLLDEEDDQAGPGFLDGFISLMRLTYSSDRPGLMNWSQEQSKLFREKQKSFLSYCLRMVRESCLMTQGAGQVVKQTPAESDFTRKFHPFIHENNVEAIASEFESAIFHLERNGNASIIFLDLALTLIPLVKK
jgi:DNA polymerase-3 subunit delta'